MKNVACASQYLCWLFKGCKAVRPSCVCWSFDESSATSWDTAQQFISGASMCMLMSMTQLRAKSQGDHATAELRHIRAVQKANMSTVLPQAAARVLQYVVPKRLPVVRREDVVHTCKRRATHSSVCKTTTCCSSWQWP